MGVPLKSSLFVWRIFHAPWADLPGIPHRGERCQSQRCDSWTRPSRADVAVGPGRCHGMAWDVMPGWIAADLVLGAKFAERPSEMFEEVIQGVPKVTLAYFGNHSMSAVHFGCWLISSNLENNWNRCSEEE